MMYPCSCCGFLTREEDRLGTYDVCPVCGWEDDYSQVLDPHYSEGANGVSLNDAILSFRLHGYCSERMRNYVRKPIPSEIPDGGY